MTFTIKYLDSKLTQEMEIPMIVRILEVDTDTASIEFEYIKGSIGYF